MEARVEESLRVITDRIVREFHPLKVILFGSQARGDAGRDSDIDLLVVLPEVEDRRKAIVSMYHLASDMPVAKDFVVTTPDEIACRGHLVGTVLRDALREGKTIYMSDPELMKEVRHWMQYVVEDLRTATEILEGENSIPRHSCGFAQQAVEKALKAILIFLRRDYPRIHDVDALRNLIPEDWSVRGEFPHLGTLNMWIVESRYPSLEPDATHEQAESAVALACAVVECVISDFAERGFVLPNDDENELQEQNEPTSNGE